MKTMINIKDGTVLSDAGEGHILVYSSSGGYYYAVPMSTLFKYEDDSIKALKEESDAKDTEQDEKFNDFKEEVSKKMEEMEKADIARDAKVDEMISNYKESMTKVFEMIEKLQGESK